MNILLNDNLDIVSNFFFKEGITDKKIIEKKLSEINLTSKDDLLELADNNLDLNLREAMLFSETSGTTNNPLQTPRCKEDFDWNSLNQKIAYKEIIQSKIDRVAVFHPSVLSPFIEASVKALQDLNIGYVRLFPIENICNYERIFQVLEKYQITTIMSTPSLVYKLFYEIYVTQSKKLKYIKNILLTGEYISKENIFNFKKIVGDDVNVRSFVYGSSEAATLLIGNGDDTYKGIYEDFVYELINVGNTEFSHLDTETSRHGNLVVTWLRSGLMPIYRYNTGDLFKIDFNSGNKIFTALGRDTDASISLFDRNMIDYLIYSSEIIIFDYKISCVKNNEYLVDIVSEKEVDGSYVHALQKRLNNTFEKKYTFIIRINNNELDFYKFSAKPKISKF